MCVKKSPTKRLPNCAPSEYTRPTKKWCPDPDDDTDQPDANDANDPEYAPSDYDPDGSDGGTRPQHRSAPVLAVAPAEKPRIQTKRGYLDKDEVEGLDIVFLYPDFGPGYFVLRCEKDTPGTWKRSPMDNAQNHWLKQDCPTHDCKRKWKKDEIMMEFAFRGMCPRYKSLRRVGDVTDMRTPLAVDGIDEAWVDHSNARRKRNLDSLAAQTASTTGRKKKGGRKSSVKSSAKGATSTRESNDNLVETVIAQPSAGGTGTLATPSSGDRAGVATTPAESTFTPVNAVPPADQSPPTPVRSDIASTSAVPQESAIVELRRALEPQME